ncbi:MAG: amidophosphoribosyltransferase [Candidatus Kryptonium sp.]|nr:amidophosphoribosyltransferase [Candidatus Kryptonium sp.]MCX7763152.1 amidophosphoribosyltransferase [Candidatus Kryptonium sp.]MDW8109121.1 amidophosphoribosyltransferase [Candidatus Kryptonium sp.]
MCGIFGIYGHPQSALMTYYGLYALQHRGQESTGIVTCEKDELTNKVRFNFHKGLGLVADVFKDEKIITEYLKGTSAIGHNRYSTTGATNKANIQPFVVHYKNGNLAIAHNGNLTNTRYLRNKLQSEGTIFQSSTDTEIILHLIARSQKENQIDQIKDALNQVEGAYSLVILTDDKLIAIRDPYGFRPLALGVMPEGSYVVASETCAFDLIGAKYIRDVLPGEILVIDDEVISTGLPKSYWIDKKVEKTAFCIFEFVYFSRPDSKIFGENVDKVRRKLGKLLAHEHPAPQSSEDDKVIVINVPDSSNTATLGFASESNKLGNNVKIEIGLIRSHYVGRTFIQPQQNLREFKVKVKFNTVKGVLEGKRVVIVDDSIVRGTTSKALVRLIKEAGAKEVHFRVASPPIKYPCYYGMDFPDQDELIASRLNGDTEEIRKELGVETLGYLSVEKLLESAPKHLSFCIACFTGNYPTSVEEKPKKLEHELNIKEATERFD